MPSYYMTVLDNRAGVNDMPLSRLPKAFCVKISTDMDKERPETIYQPVLVGIISKLNVCLVKNLSSSV